MTTVQETWAPVRESPHYLVSDLGRVMSTHRGRSRVLRGRVNNHGYRTLDLAGVGTRTVHGLVAEAFLEPRPAWATLVRHADGNSLDNRASNLRWGTDSSNAHDRVRHGRDRNARKTHCAHGHPFDAENTYLRPDKRDCRKCNAQSVARYKARLRGEP